MGEVVALKPKTIEQTYRNTRFVVSYDMETKMWGWQVTHVKTTVFTGDQKPTWQLAKKAAEKHIDRTIEIGG